MKPVYLDYNATTPVDPRVADAMLPYLTEHFGNPSSSHAFGAEARKAVDRARRQVAALLGCGVDEVLFTSGGSESNNLAIKGVAEAYRDRGRHIVTSAVEHPAVAEVCRHLAARGWRVTWLPVDEAGLVDPADLAKAMTPQTILVTVMHANNEVGTIEPVAELAAIARAGGALFHSDCAQSLGKIPVRVDALGADLVSVAGHKLYAPKGVGALYVRGGVRLAKLIHGADHEMDRRAGTENVPEIVGLGAACEIAGRELDAEAPRLAALRDRLQAGLAGRFPGLRVNGHPERRLPNTLSVSFRGLEANTILAELDGVAASAGAACHADGVDVSAVLEAMRVPLEEAMGTIRFSVGRFSTEAEVDRAVAAVADVVARLAPREGAAPAVAVPGAFRLTQYTHGLGCACKLRPQLLEEVLKRLPRPDDPAILVGTDTADDAAVYRLDAETAIVETVDFFTPVVDDPYDFGAVAAANSLSDIYAMGARPLFALNIVGFPSARLPMSVLEAILQGALDKAAEAGIAVIGGHTVDDTEPKFGWAVTGIVHPDRVLTNRGARPGDALVLTKPIGTGILSTALKRGLLEAPRVAALVATMAALNRAAAEAAQAAGARACTDVTGFGLLGHLLEMMQGAGARAVVEAGAVPLLAGALELATGGVIPGGSRDNMEHVAPHVAYAAALGDMRRLLLNDAQTSGGLLIALPEARAAELLDRLGDAGVAAAARIGAVEAAPPGIRVVA
ncbi:MAG: selenide, water dikinase SelD [Candidatus Krumholzibacteriota bacterium]|nr:selenide, water dikinase SelD [Candidatus Krumholzibacteriota bacterium]